MYDGNNLRILLIDVGYPQCEFNEPLGIEILANLIDSNFINIKHKLISLQIENVTPEFINHFSPHVIGISTKIGASNVLVDLQNKLGKLDKGIAPIVILGDIVSTLAANKLLEHWPNVLCVIGEGEKTFQDIICLLLKCRCTVDLEKFKSIILKSRIPNLCFKYKNRLVTTNRFTYLNIPSFVLPNRIFLKEILKRKGLIRIESSRGCPYNKCSFCVVNFKYNNSGWRPFETSSIIEEIVNLSHYTIDTIFFTDEDFLGGKISRLKLLVDTIDDLKKRKIIDPNLKFFSSTSVRSILGKGRDYAFDELFPILCKMRTIGFSGFFLGIESGSEKQLVRFNKGVSVDDNSKVLKLLSDLNFDIDIGFIMFDPETDILELEENINFMKKNNLISHFSRFGKKLRLIPKTPICNRLNLKANFDLNDLEYKYDFVDPRINIIYHYFHNFEKMKIKDSYEYQSRLRSSSYLLPKRKAVLRKSLGSLRELDFLFLEKCIEEAKLNNANFENRIELVHREFSRRLLNGIKKNEI